MPITDLLSRITGKPTFARGIHPPTRKSGSADRAIEVLPNPATVTVPLHQHAGAPAQLAVKPRAKVVVGELIGRATPHAISANVHASIDGTALAVTAVTLPNGRRSLAVPIKGVKTSAEEVAPTGQPLWDRLLGGDWPLQELRGHSREQIASAVEDAGIVGQGGAAFPTHVKLATRPQENPIDVVLLNGCECEPYLTADYRLMIEAPLPIVAGLQLVMQASGAARGMIAVEDNKPAAIESMRAASQPARDVEIIACETKYPMGGERQLIPAVLGKEVPTGGLPLDIGVLVINVATAASIAAAVLRGSPLTHRVVSVSGEGIREPKNLLVPVGTSLDQLIECCGGTTGDARRVIAGGPMMGFSVTDLTAPITKGTSGITVLSGREVAGEERATCIRCGKCIDVCPLGLAPTRIAHAAKFSDYDLARKYDLMACCECGCCAYVCPSRIPLVQYIRMGKSVLMRQ